MRPRDVEGILRAGFRVRRRHFICADGVGNSGPSLRSTTIERFCVLHVRANRDGRVEPA